MSPFSMETLVMTVTTLTPSAVVYSPKEEAAMDCVVACENDETMANAMYCVAVCVMQLEFNKKPPLARGAAGGRPLTCFWDAVESDDARAGGRIKEVDRKTVEKWIASGKFLLEEMARQNGTTIEETADLFVSKALPPSCLPEIDLCNASSRIYSGMSKQQKEVMEIIKSKNGGKPPGKRVFSAIKSVPANSPQFAYIKRAAEDGKIIIPTDFDRQLNEANDVLRKEREETERRKQEEVERKAREKADEEAASVQEVEESKPEVVETSDQPQPTEVPVSSTESSEAQTESERDKDFKKKFHTRSISQAPKDALYLEHLSRWNNPVVKWMTLARTPIHKLGSRLESVNKEVQSEWGTHHRSYEIDWETMDLLPPEIMGEDWVKAFTIAKDADGNVIVDRKKALVGMERSLRRMADLVKTIRETTTFEKGNAPFTVTP